MKKDNRLIIVGGIGALAVGLVGTLYFATSDIGKEPLINTEEVAETQPIVVSESQKQQANKTDKKEEDVVRIFSNYQERITPIGYGEKEFPAEQAGTLKSSLVEMAEAGEVEKMISEVERQLESYRFSEGVNLEIAGLYHDATVTQGLIGKTEAEMRKILPNAYKTPEMLAVMTLYLPEHARRDMIRDSMSLTPLTEGPFKINGTRYIDNREDADNDEIYQENGVGISMFNVVDSIRRIHVVEVIREEEPDVTIRAYISELANGQLQLYGYYIPDDVTHYYQTVEFFKELDAEYIEPNAEYQQELLQEELKKGNIPPEAMDAFLNPTQ